MDNQKACPYCKQAIPEDAEHCHHCGERVVGRICDDCRSLCPEDARKCRWCGFVFSDAAKRIGIEDFEITAGRLPTFLMRFRLLRQRVQFNEEKLTLVTPGLLHLWVNESEVPWNKVAGFDYRSGIFWDAVTIETRGQKPTIIRCLPKPAGERLREILRKLEV